MAQLVMGLGTSHGSQVSLTTERSLEHGLLDRKRTPCDDLLQAPRPDLEQQIDPALMEKRYQAAQDAVAELGRILQGADLDAVIVVGDDQGELFSHDSMPAVALYWGDQVLDIPRDMTDVPASRAAAMWAKHAQ